MGLASPENGKSAPLAVKAVLLQLADGRKKAGSIAAGSITSRWDQLTC